MNWLIIIAVLIAMLYTNNLVEGFHSHRSSMYPIVNDDAHYPSIIDPQTFYKYDIGRFQRDRPCLKNAVHQCPNIRHNYPVNPIIYRDEPLDGCSARKPPTYAKLPEAPARCPSKVPQVVNTCPQTSQYIAIPQGKGEQCGAKHSYETNTCPQSQQQYPY